MVVRNLAKLNCELSGVKTTTEHAQLGNPLGMLSNSLLQYGDLIVMHGDQILTQAPVLSSILILCK